MRSRAILGITGALALSLSVSTAGASLQESIIVETEPAATPIPSQEEIQVAAVCYVENDLGGRWWWNHPNVYIAQNNAMRLCRQNTPPYGTCYHVGCG
tara:strand:+ start:350 stop:643 length:294 start_codon:yes stop_codon:yes gene_type:complete